MGPGMVIKLPGNLESRPNKVLIPPLPKSLAQEYVTWGNSNHNFNQTNRDQKAEGPSAARGTKMHRKKRNETFPTEAYCLVPVPAWRLI